MKHLIIPDVQAKEGVPLEHLRWIGEYIMAKQPDVVVCIGDFADMPSLSHYDVGKKSFEGRRYKADIQIAHKAMDMLLGPLKKSRSKYAPKLHLTLGNHEDRIDRAIEADAKLEGVLSLRDLKYEEAGWKVHPFLKPVNIDGIMYNHYFPSGMLGRPIPNARLLLQKMHMSCIAGHLQGRDIAYGKRADGVEITGIIAGSCYLHDEDYLSPFTNQHWRGVIMAHQVKDGQFDEMMVNLSYLEKKYS